MSSNFCLAPKKFRLLKKRFKEIGVFFLKSRANLRTVSISSSSLNIRLVIVIKGDAC